MKKIVAVILAVLALTTVTLSIEGNYSNYGEVRSKIESGGGTLVWGSKKLNEAEHMEFISALNRATVEGNPRQVLQYFDQDKLNQIINEFLRNAPGVGRRAMDKLIIKAFNNPEQVFREDKLEVSAGVATYREWKRVIKNETRTYKCRWKGPSDKWTWGECTNQIPIEVEVQLPSQYEPYIRFRIAG
jgi:hypothetical protein